jgi:hypothetical protein
MKKNIIPSIIVLFFIGYCTRDKSEETKEPAQEKKKFEYVTGNSNTLSTFKNNLMESDYYYDAEITELLLDTQKRAFEVKADEYSEATYQDGLKFSFIFKYTNPYDKAMIVPIPESFFLTVDGSTNYGSYSKGCHCDILGYGKVTTSKGKDLSDVYDERLEGSYPYGFKFKAKETKAFKVTFDNILSLDLNKILMLGFAEKKAGWVDGVESGLEINIQNARVERKVFYNKGVYN